MQVIRGESEFFGRYVFSALQKPLEFNEFTFLNNMLKPIVLCSSPIFYDLCLVWSFEDENGSALDCDRGWLVDCLV